MSFSELISPLLGRAMLAWFFLSSAFEMMGNFEGTSQLMTMAHIPAAPLLLVGVLTVLLLGGSALLLGFHTRAGALMLFAFTLIASVVMHAFWKINNPIDRAADFELFARNVAIAGGLLLLVGMGPGAFAIDNRLGPKKR
ncbi:MAG TPA: DoxX family protein [Rhizomicrobium sp.]|jgi:putative oxidoreductase